MPEETMDHSGETSKPQHIISSHIPTATGVGSSSRSPSLRSKSTSDQKIGLNIIRKWGIYRVPSKLRNVNAAAYTPQLLSIGPFHYGKPELKDMEKHKKIYSDNFRKRYWEGIQNRRKLSEKGKGPNKKSDDEKADSLRTLLKVSEKIDCYAEFDLNVNRKKVVEIIQVDAFFIIELFMRNSEVECHDKDYILSSPWLRKAIELELILIENQLPFSLLRDIYIKMSPAFSSSLRQEQAQAHKDETVIDIDEKAGNEFLELTCKFFKDFGMLVEDAVPKLVEDAVPKHFTDLVRHFMLPHVEKKVKWEATTKNRHSITMLTAAGVNFMPAVDDKRLVIKIDDPQAPDSKHKLNLACFRSMNLKLTRFCVKDDTECFIRNVMALEQFVYPEKPFVCNYFLMLDTLVNTVEDVDYLVEKRVIVNMLGSNQQVAQMVNKLCDHIMEEKSHYNQICEQLNTRYKSSLNRHLVSLKRVYFKDVWTGSATFFGVVLVLLTIVEILKSFRQ